MNELVKFTDAECGLSTMHYFGFSQVSLSDGERRTEGFLPPLTDQEYESLKNSVRRFGPRSTVLTDQFGNPVDGTHLDRACQELKLFCPRVVQHFDSEIEKHQVALALNCNRGFASRKAKRKLIANYLLKDPGINDRNLSELVAVSKNTVADDRAELERKGQIDHLEERRCRDGKERAANNRRIVASSPKELEKALSAIKNLPPSATNKIMDVTTADRHAARHKNKIAREERQVLPLSEGDIRLYHCCFQELQTIAGIEPGTANLVLTDIPYGQEFLDQIEDLALFAKTVLVDGGLFVTHSGQFWLHKVIAGLCKHLEYRWTNCSVWNGEATPVHIGGWKEPHARVLSKWKPILVYSKGGFRKRGQWCDVSHVNEKEKDWHPWQLSLIEVEMMVRYFSDPGDLVIDPCSGGFTTAVACRNLGRRCIACDVDEQCVQRGLERLATTPRNDINE